MIVDDGGTDGLDAGLRRDDHRHVAVYYQSPRSSPRYVQGSWLLPGYSEQYLDTKTVR